MPKHDNGGAVAKLLSAGGAAAAIGGAYKLGEFLHKAKRLTDVGPSNAVYVRSIGRVRADLDEVRRLLTVREVHDELEANKDKAKWVYGAMRDVRGALENIAPLTERVGGDIEEGRRVGLRHRVYWLLSEKEKLANREKELGYAHASLTEVIGYLTALEPCEAHEKHGKHHHRGEKHHDEKQHHEKVDKKVDIDIDIRHEGPGRERIEREVYIERDERGPRRVVEERETYIEHEREHRRPRRVEEHYVERDHRGPVHYEQRETYVDEYGRPQHYDEREVYVEHGQGHGQGHDPRYESQRYESQHYDDRQYDDRHVDRRVEREVHIERDPRHVEARYSERGPSGRYEEKRYEERRFNEPLGRRPESFEDRVPERETWMQSEMRRSGQPGEYGRHGEYAEYGAPQPIGPANYRRKFKGDAGFGDEVVLNPQIVPPNREFEREVSTHSLSSFRLLPLVSTIKRKRFC
jgi:hypothetical protein